MIEAAEHATPTAVASPSATDAKAALIARVKAIADSELAPLVHQIDADGFYPEAQMRAFGTAGAYGAHVGPGTDLVTAIDAMSVVSEHCLSTSFCMWCQSALAWYIANTENTGLKDALLAPVATGEKLGGTGLSNPMKAFFGIERIRLKGTRVAGGYQVKGLLPWVSNLGPDHAFGAIFETDDASPRRVMAVVDCNGPGVKITQNDNFVALDGTRTYAIQMRDAFISDDAVLADPIHNYLPKIRAGFILLQAGMAFGLIRNCIELMEQVQDGLGHVNKYLEKQPADFAEDLAAMQALVAELCATPYNPDPAYFRRVVEARLVAGEAAVSAAHFAMLHQGARGYVANGAAQRRLREAYFVAIVTPATKQLRKMLAEMKH